MSKAKTAAGAAVSTVLREVPDAATAAASGLVRACEGGAVFERIDALADQLRDAVQDAAVYVSTRPGRSHEAAVTALSCAAISVGCLRRQARNAKQEVDDAEWASR